MMQEIKIWLRVATANDYEKNVLRNLLTSDLKKKFDRSKAVVKYLNLKIMGEALGGLLNNLRAEMFSKMIKSSQLCNIIEKSKKKTVCFSTYVDVVKSIDAVAALTTTLNNELAGKETNQEDLYNTTHIPTWDQTINEFKNNIIPIKLNYKEYLQDMGVLYHYCDDFMKAALKEDVDEGDITLVSDVQKPQREFFNSEYFYNWANTMYYYTKSADFGEQPYLKVFTEGDLHK